MQMHEGSVWLIRESRQKMRRMICRMTMQELRQQTVRQQAAGRMLTKRTAGQAVHHRMRQGILAGMASCRRTAASLQKLTAKL